MTVHPSGHCLGSFWFPPSFRHLQPKCLGDLRQPMMAPACLQMQVTSFYHPSPAEGEYCYPHSPATVEEAEGGGSGSRSLQSASGAVAPDTPWVLS